MFETIIVPLDGSSSAEAVLPTVVDIARHFRSLVVLVDAVDIPTRRRIVPAESPATMTANRELVEKVVSVERQRAERYLSELRARLDDGSFSIEAVVLEGEPSQAIVAIAREKRAALIAMSTHGRGGIDRLVFGSVADGVMRNTGVPVLVVRPG